MGLFSRNKKTQSNGDSLHTQSTSDFRAPYAMSRASTNPAQNASIPDIPLPKAPDPNVNPAGYLRSIYAVRERCSLVLEKAKRNQLRHFTVDMSKFNDTARFVVSIIKVRGQRSDWLLPATETWLTCVCRSVTSTPTTNRSRRTADGSISRSAAGRGSTSSWPPGRAASTSRSGHAG
jgi:hypothetical protein